MLNTIAAIAQTIDKALILPSLSQPAIINNNARGGNTLNNDGIAEISSFLFFVMVPD